MGVYIVGMHRSGTSALSAMTSALGGMSVTKLATESNPAGQWERAELRPALELMLAWNRCTWAHPPAEAQPLTTPPMLRAYLNRVFAQHCNEPFLWKDPRLCLTIDIWLAMSQPEPRVLFIHREPTAVAASLQRRNGWPMPRGLALWERTIRNATVRLHGRSVFAVPHRWLQSEPEVVAGAVAEWIGAPSDQASLVRAVDAAASQRKGGSGSDPVHAHELTEPQGLLAERLVSAKGPCTLSIDDIGFESASTAAELGSAGAVELATRTVRALRAVPRRYRNQVAGS